MAGSGYHTQRGQRTWLRELRVTGFDQIEYAGVTDPGIRRPQNEDCHAVLLAVDAEQWQRQGHIFLVADGMGGHAVGELASELAAGIIPHTYHKYAAEGPAAALRKALLEANASIHSRGQQNLDFKGMGTTSTALLLLPDAAWIGHVGDSRAYRVRDGQIEQLTFDHSWVWELARRQNVSPDKLKGIATNYINRSLGPDPLVQIDIEGPHPLRGGDTFVLCSDGLSNQVTDQELGAVVSVLPPAEACQVLMQLANLRGGPDNITVVVAHVREAPPEPGAPSPAPVERRPWYRLLPWPLVALFLGVILAAQAAVLSANQASGGKWVFLLAAASLLTGLAGLGFYYLRDLRHPPASAEDRPLKVYRHHACRIDRPLVERLADAEAALSRWAREKNWEVDWAANQHHREQAESFLQKGDLPAAFREYCRAVRPLTAVSQRDHFKEEGFQAVWERSPPS
jgi:PPM family protein phosphatase